MMLPERAGQIHADHAIPLVAIEQVDGPTSGDTGRVDHHVESSVALDDLVDGVAHRRFVGDVDLVVYLAGQIEGDDGGPLGHESFGAGGTDARPTAGDQSDATVETTHQRASADLRMAPAASTAPAATGLIEPIEKNPWIMVSYRVSSTGTPSARRAAT